MNDLEEFKIEDFNIGDNLFIEASAGTGKTYTIELLVEKMIANEISLPNILIVTYTEKATGELRDRIRNKLENCIKINEKDVKLQKLYINALQDIGNAQIYTFHSFCQNILKNFTFETKSPLTLELVNDKEIESIVDKYIRDKWVNNKEFENLIYSDNFNIDYFKEECINAADRYSLFQFDESKKNNENTIKKDNKKSNKKEEIELIKQTFILNHFKELIKEWNKYKNDNNLISYADMINLVHDKICNDAETSLISKLRQVYRYAIIDEFQDTNQKQWDIFSKIFLDENNIIQNNIIVVGDPKQSIFSFQGAEIDVYSKAIKKIGNGRKLINNYRSSRTMIYACNELFNNKEVANFFDDNDIIFSNSEYPYDKDKENSLKIDNNYYNKAFLNSEEIKPILLAQQSDEHTYAKFAVSKIVEYCKLDENSKTALQIFDKKTNKLRNVSYSDFAILARTRTELPFFEEEMKNLGIPFYRYKDNSLFNSRECEDWISLLMLLDTPDFASRNRKILNKALLSNFFRIDIDNIESEDNINPNKEPMSYILEWKKYAEKRQWAELKEKIYQDTKIDKYLSEKSMASNLIKLRQIGNYIFNYFFNYNVSIEEMVTHLKLLASNSGNSETEGELVENSNDLDAVKVMTIYAAKGLEFPVVIVAASLRGENNKIRGPFVYSEIDDNNEKYKILGYERNKKNKEDFTEWRRLMYVAYTRAKYILILPNFSNKKSWGANKRKGNITINKNAPFYFLRVIFNNIEKTKLSDFVSIDNFNNIENNFNDFSRAETSNKKNDDNVSVKDSDSLRKKAIEDISNLQKSLPLLRTYQFSYSSISSSIKEKLGITFNDYNENIEQILDNNDVSENGERFDKDESNEDENKDSQTYKLNEFKNIDKVDNIIKVCNNYKVLDIKDEIINEDYPKGARLGNAIHEIFEFIVFDKFGKLKASEINDIQDINNLIVERFEKQSLPIKDNNNWQKITTKILWNTLNADLPVIHGNEVCDETFKLNSLSDSNRKSEVEFFFEMNEFSELEANSLKDFCKGFIDLLFVRKENGNVYYSILDWKSDYMSEEKYYDREALANKVAEEYTVQRILYSYLLIKWLKHYYNNLSYEEIFKKHFGGIYYIFVRGCKADCSNGVYAQTWKSYSALKESYDKLINELGIKNIDM